MLRDASYLACIHPPTELYRMYDGHDASVDECSSHTFLLRTHSKSPYHDAFVALMIDNILASLQASQIYHILYLFMLALMSANVMGRLAGWLTISEL